MFPKRRDHLRFEDSYRHYDVLTKTRSKMTTAISFSRQNDTGSRARALCLLEKLVVVLVLESKDLYYELTIRPAPCWIDSSVGTTLHRHRRSHGFESRSSLNFFRLFFSNCLSCKLTASIFLQFDLSSAVQNICFIYLHSINEYLVKS